MTGNGDLSMNYYADSCPRAEEIVKEEVEKLYHKHGNTAVSWIRNLFHDCIVKVYIYTVQIPNLEHMTVNFTRFLQSCDASLLLETTSTIISEQESPRSFGMRNFKYINNIKGALEAECPTTVSCADIAALSAREGVALVCL